VTPLQAAQSKLDRHIQRQGLKQTRQRMLILEAFLAAGSHLSVEEVLRAVHENYPAMGAATVYRTLKLFVEAGIAHERNFGDGQARYEAAHDNEHHDHLICTDCQEIFEFEEPEIERRQAEVAEVHGIRLKSHRHEIYGECIQREACPRWPRS
jgi:Fur family transcriptional regulator, ferric uptake regulator